VEPTDACEAPSLEEEAKRAWLAKLNAPMGAGVSRA
jgi:hypothetical protein